jgi:hypothetical protein
MTDYLRTARRLRARFAGRPARLQQELRQLNRDVSPAVDPLPDPTPARIFSESVAAAMEGPVLRYSARQRLLKQARRMGIERFEANLLIAAVQHRMGIRWDQAATPAGNRWVNPVAIILGVQALVGTLLWLAMR